MFKKMKVLLATTALCLGLSGCFDQSQTVTVNTVVLSSAIVEFENNYQRIQGSVTHYQDQFTAAQLMEIERVRKDIQRVRTSIVDIVHLHDGAKGTVIDLSNFLDAVEQLKWSYNRAYESLKGESENFRAPLKADLKQFHQSTLNLNAAYQELSSSGGDKTQLIIQTLKVVGAGIRLFGV